MEKKEIQLKKTEVTTDIICDCCGKSCMVDKGNIDNKSRVDNGEKYYEFEFMKLEATLGYRSGKDGQKYTAQICEKCVDEKLSFINLRRERYLQ